MTEKTLTSRPLPDTSGNSADWKSRFALPEDAIRGQRIQVRTLLAHPMESGYRRDFQGEAIERNIIKHFDCHYMDERIFAAELFPAIAANPYLSFYLTARESGIVTCRWTDQHGASVTASKILQVTP